MDLTFGYQLISSSFPKNYVFFVLVTGSLQQRNSKASSTSDTKAPPTVTPIPTSTVQVKDEPIADDVEETKSDNGTAASDIKTEEFDLGIVKNDQNSKSG